MTESFKPSSLTINKFLTDSDSFYQIPRYQRPYKWTDEEVDQLWEDLWESYENDVPNYFLGSVITARPERGQYWDIVDGQQRLTTIMILMAVVRDLYPTINDDDLEDLNAVDITTVKNAIVRDGKFQRLRLVTHSNHQSDFDDIIINGDTLQIKKPFKKDIRKDEEPKYKFLNTAYLFREKLESIGLKESGKFINYIFNHVHIIRIDCSDVSFAIKLFQVLNARGLDLTNSDLIKSFLLGNLHQKYKEDPDVKKQKEDQFLQDWVAIEKIASSVDQSTNDLLVMYEYYLLAANPRKSLYDELIIQFKNKDPNQVIKDFKAFCEVYEKYIIDAQDDIIYSFFYVPWSIYWRTVLLTALHEGYKDYEELKVVLRNFYYQHWIAGYTLTRVKQPSFNIIKWIKENKPINEIKNELINVCKNNQVERRVNDALNGSIYGDPWCKPLLFLIEYNQTDNPHFISISDRNIHVEHILPQKFEKLYGWKEMIEMKEEANSLVHTCGNLTLLSGKKNIEANNSPFEEKIKIYRGKGLYEHENEGITSFRITQKIVDDYTEGKFGKSWNLESIEARKKWFLNQVSHILKINLKEYQEIAED